MNRQEMLEKMHLTPEQFTGLLEQFLQFYNLLDQDQQRVMQRSMLPLERAARTFGPGVTPGDIEKLVLEHGGVAGLCECTAGDNGPIW